MRLYSVRLYLEPDPSGVYTVSSSDVPGLVTEGGTRAEILANVQEALEALRGAWEELGIESPSPLRQILAGRSETVQVLVAA